MTASSRLAPEDETGATHSLLSFYGSLSQPEPNESDSEAGCVALASGHSQPRTLSCLLFAVTASCGEPFTARHFSRAVDRQAASILTAASTGTVNDPPTTLGHA